MSPRLHPPPPNIKVNADVYQTSRVSFEGCLGLKAHFVSYIVTLGLAIQQDLIICCLGELRKREQVPTLEARTWSIFQDPRVSLRRAEPVITAVD